MAHTGGAGKLAKWRSVVDPSPADRRDRCHQSQVTLGCQAKQNCISPQACELFGGRRGRRAGEASAARHECGTEGHKSD